MFDQSASAYIPELSPVTDTLADGPMLPMSVPEFESTTALLLRSTCQHQRIVSGRCQWLASYCSQGNGPLSGAPLDMPDCLNRPTDDPMLTLGSPYLSRSDSMLACTQSTPRAHALL